MAHLSTGRRSEGTVRSPADAAGALFARPSRIGNLEIGQIVWLLGKREQTSDDAARH